MFTLHFFRALVTSLRALSQNKARFWLFYLLIRALLSLFGSTVVNIEVSVLIKAPALMNPVDWTWT